MAVAENTDKVLQLAGSSVSGLGGKGDVVNGGPCNRLGGGVGLLILLGAHSFLLAEAGGCLWLCQTPS